MTSPLQLRYMLAMERVKTAFATNSFSGSMNPNIQSGASYLPPGKVPSLRAPIEKSSGVLSGVSPSPTKIAAGAPTRGGFMMASDIPPFRAPGLKAPLEKSSDMLPDYITYNQGDFAPAKLTGRTKSAGTSPFQAAQTAKTIGTPKINAPGPSIAEIAKPKGAGFGTGIAGAFKPSTGISGTAPVGLSSNPGSSR